MRRRAASIARCAAKASASQAFALDPKLREVDLFLSSHRRLCNRLFEVHDEVSYALWADVAGFTARRPLRAAAPRTAPIEESWPIIDAQLREDLGRGGYRSDDLQEAIAALWTTIRYASRHDKALIAQPELDD